MTTSRPNSRPSSLAAVPDGTIVRLARWVLAHRRLILVLWAAAFIAGAYGASHVSKRLKLDFSLPGQPGYETAKEVTHLYGNGGDSRSSVVVVTVPAGRTVAGERTQIARAFQQARMAAPR